MSSSMSLIWLFPPIHSDAVDEFRASLLPVSALRNYVTNLIGFSVYRSLCISAIVTPSDVRQDFISRRGRRGERQKDRGREIERGEKEKRREWRGRKCCKWPFGSRDS